MTYKEARRDFLETFIQRQRWVEREPVTYPEENDCKAVAADIWPSMDDAAYHGLVGEVTKGVEPYSEADPVGILLHLLVGAGSVIGSSPHVLVEHTKHYARTNVLFVGRTASGRKGTAFAHPRRILSAVDEQWAQKRVRSGLSSGEGLIFQVRDPSYRLVRKKKGNRSLDGLTADCGDFEQEPDDPGEPDKRLLIIESEFAGALKVMERECNTLSPVMRDAWDHGTLTPLTKKDRMTATGAHITIIGHISRDELRRMLAATERVNGFANRFIFAAVRRSKYIPSRKGAPLEILEPYFMRFMRTIESAKKTGELCRDPEAEALWAHIYPKLGEEMPGLTGAMLARAEAQVLRLSLLYSLLDESEVARITPAIRVPHLLAALAVWEYCKESALMIFGDATGDPLADRMLRAIKSAPRTDTDLYEMAGKHASDKARKDLALELLLRIRSVHTMVEKTAGRSVHWWHRGRETNCGLCAKWGEKVSAPNDEPP